MSNSFPCFRSANIFRRLLMACKRQVFKLARSISVSLKLGIIQQFADLFSVGNEQEKNRDTMNNVIDDRVNHEVCLDSLSRFGLSNPEIAVPLAFC